MAEAKGKTRWDLFTQSVIDSLSQQLKAQPLAAAVIGAEGLKKKGVEWLNSEVPQSKTAAPVQVKKPESLAFEQNATAASPTAPVAQGNDPASLFAAALGGPVKITSGFRDPAKNAKVGGVTGSDHTKRQADGSPMAWDIVPPKGVSTSDAARILAAQGFGTIDEGDHVHVSKNPVQVARGALQGDSSRGFVSLAPGVAPGDTMNAGGVVAPDPRMLMGMIKDPRMLPQVDLPSAPQRELPADQPLLAMLDKAGLLADLKSASAVKPRDGKFDKWDRIRAALEGAAGGAAGADPMRGTGAFLARVGAGASSGARQETQQQEEEILRNEEMTRQLAIMLARAGLDVDLKNVDVGNANADRSYKSGETKKDIKFTNANVQFENELKEVLTNLGIRKENIGELNQADRARANVGIQATQGLAAAQNRSTENQVQVNQQGAQRELYKAKNVDDGIDQEMLAMGLDPKASKDPLVLNARQTLLAANAKNPAMAMAGLGQELVMSGNYKDVLGDKDIKAVETAIRQKNVEGAAQIVTSALMANMQSNPAAVLKLVDELAALGLPSATIISSKRKRSAAGPTQ